MTVEFRILGPLEIQADEGVHCVLGARRRELLALLLINADQVVPAQHIIEELWPGRRSDGMLNALQAQISRLRWLVGSWRDAEADTPSVVTRYPGYEFKIGSGRLDAERFRQLSTEGRVSAVDEPERAISILGEALALWRGPALIDVGGAMCRAAAARLDRTRLTTHECMIDLLLQEGRHHEVIDDLELLLAEHPLQEGLYGRLMIALYRCGRLSESLDIYHLLRTNFARELGIDPSPHLTELMHAVIRNDGSLHHRAGRAPGAGDTRVAHQWAS
jgi:DNA-binding SARP family transcriptional activator